MQENGLLLPYYIQTAHNIYCAKLKIGKGQKIWSEYLRSKRFFCVCGGSSTPKRKRPKFRKVWRCGRGGGGGGLPHKKNIHTQKNIHKIFTNTKECHKCHKYPKTTENTLLKYPKQCFIEISIWGIKTSKYYLKNTL